jgi:outer membrane protein OmpA-like peptidoglycan-associated protein
VRKVEGRVHRTTYVLLNAQAGATRSALEVARNYQIAVKDAGFGILWSGDNAAVRNGPPQADYSVPELDHQMVSTGLKDRNYFCAEKSGLFTAVFVSERSWDHKMLPSSPVNPWKKAVTIPTGAIVIQVDMVDTRPMEEKMVLVTAAEMQKSIDNSGKVALYGIYFDFNKADVKPESAPALKEIAALLTANPQLKVLVVGHTDNVGDFGFNKDLSERRAAAVAAALKANYGIAAERLTPLGASFMAPVATNKSEEGRALNRRVELVAR